MTATQLPRYRDRDVPTLKGIGIILANKTIHNEAIPILYSTREFFIDNLPGRPTPNDTIHFVNTIGPANHDHIQHMTFNLLNCCRHHFNHWHRIMSWILPVGHKLKTLRFEVEDILQYCSRYPPNQHPPTAKAAKQWAREFHGLIKWAIFRSGAEKVIFDGDVPPSLVGRQDAVELLVSRQYLEGLEYMGTSLVDLARKSEDEWLW